MNDCTLSSTKTQPECFVYLIGWSNFDRWYIGSKYAKDAHPSQLWTTYFTSSKTVRKYRKKHGDPDVIMVLKTFSDPVEALKHESKLLIRLNTVASKRFLNQHDGANFKRAGKHVLGNEPEYHPEITCPYCGKTGTRGMHRWHFDFCKANPNRKEHDLVECPHCGERGLKHHISRYHFDYCESNPNRKPRPKTSDKTRSKMRDSNLNRKVLTCPHCGAEGRNSMRHNHFDNCPENPNNSISTRTGRKHTEASKKKMQKLALNRPKLKCPHCGTEGQANIMKHIHFDNCAKNPDRAGERVSEETRKKMSAGAKNRPESTCPHCGKTGRTAMKHNHFDNCPKNPNLGERTKEQERKRTSQKIREIQLNLPRLTCPHCGTVGSPAGINRYHFDNCKSNPNRPAKEELKCPYCEKTGESDNVTFRRWHFENCKHKTKDL